jgi:hypothetical protein
MKNFKQYIQENVIDDGLDFGVEDTPLTPSYSSPSLSNYFSSTLGTGSKAVAGVDSGSMPFINYRSAALTPGAQQQEDPRFVAGGGGFKIEKESKTYFMNLAKKYGILIPDQQKQGGPPGGGQNPMAAMMGGMGGQQQGMPQQGMPQQGMPQMGGPPGGQQQPPQDRLVQHLSKNPLLSDLMSGELGQQFNKIFGEMQKWKTDAQDPKLIQKSQEPQNPYKIWAEKVKEQEQKKKQNLSVQGNILRHRIFSSDIYNRLNNIGLYDDEFNPHIRNYMDQNNYDQDLLQQLQQEQEPQEPQYQEDEEEDYYNDSDTGVDFGYYGE